MSLHRTIAHSTAIQITGKLLSTVLGFIAIALMTRSLGAEQFGWYVTASSFLLFVGILSDFGFTVVTANMLAEPAFDKDRLLSTLFTWRFITAFIFQGLAPLVFLFFPYPPVIKWAVVITSVSFFAAALNQVFLGYFRERLKILVATLGEIVGRVVLVLGIVLAIWTKTGFLSMMGVITLASVLSLVYYWGYVPKLHFSLDREISRALFHKIWPTAVAVIFNSIYLQAGRVMLPLYVSQIEVGYYGAATRVLDIVLQTTALIMGIMTPLITYAWSRRQQADFTQRFQLSINAMTLLIVPMIVGLAMLATPIMRLLAGKEFADAGTMLQWLCISLVGSYIGMIFGHINLAVNRQKQVLWIYITDATLTLGGFIYAIPHFGWRGAAAMAIFSELYAGLFLAISAVYYTKTYPAWFTFFKILLATAIMAASLYLLPTLPLALSIGMAAAVYGIALVVLRITSISSLKALLTNRRVAVEP